MTQDVLLETRGPLGLVTLDRPRALHALTLGMIRTLHPQLEAWAADPAVRAVAIRATGGRAFCAGGDVRAVHEAVQAGAPEQARAFFREEYRLNHRIHTFPKPFVALVDGICMGGGLGLSAHGSHRVVSERLVLAMPETAIGLFPDVGGGWFLPRMPGECGTYLGLTGARVGAADALLLGYATHHVPAAGHEALLAALERELAHAPAEAPDGAAGGAAGGAVQAHAAVGRVLGAHHVAPGSEAPLAAHREAVDRCFSGARMEDVLGALAREGTVWAGEVLATLSRLCPFSLALTLALLRRGRALSYPEVVTLEHRLALACVEREDFHQGVRAVLVEKHGKPTWSPASLGGVSSAEVEAAFAPRAEAQGGELVVGAAR
jgi:enoyl-CoA hydratase